MGNEPETAARTCLLATGLARGVGLTEEVVADVFYTALLLHLGCTASAHEAAAAYGAIVALAMAIHHPHTVRAAVLDEPPMLSEIPSLDQAMTVIGPIVEAGVRSGGAPEAVERFCEFASDGAFRLLDPALRKRMLGNGRALFGT